MSALEKCEKRGGRFLKLERACPCYARCVESNEEALRTSCGTGHIACELESLRTCRRSTSPLDFNECVRHNAAKINAQCEGLMFAGELHSLNRSLTFLKSKGGQGSVRTQVLADKDAPLRQ